MEQHTLSAILQDQTARALWEVKNVIDCVPDSLWDNLYCGMPLLRNAMLEAYLPYAAFLGCMDDQSTGSQLSGAFHS